MYKVRCASAALHKNAVLICCSRYSADLGPSVSALMRHSNCHWSWADCTQGFDGYRAFACILLPWKWQPFWCTASIDFHCAPKWLPWWLPRCCYVVMCKRSIGVKVWPGGRALQWSEMGLVLLIFMAIPTDLYFNVCTKLSTLYKLLTAAHNFTHSIIIDHSITRTSLIHLSILPTGY